MISEGKRVNRLGEVEQSEKIEALRRRGSVRSLKHVSIEERRSTSTGIGIGDAIKGGTGTIGGGVAAKAYYNTKRKRALTTTALTSELGSRKMLVSPTPPVTVLSPVEQESISSVGGGAEAKGVHDRVVAGVATLKAAKTYVRNVLETQMRHG